MFDEWKKRLALQRTIDAAKERKLAIRTRTVDGRTDYDALSEAQRELAEHQFRLTVFDTNVLSRKAKSLGIEIPRNDTWWWNDNEDGSLPPEAVSYYLTDFGKTSVRKLIKEERRKNVEWWVKIITPLLSALISLIGLFVALTTVLRNSPRVR